MPVTQLLSPLPEKPYKVMKPFIDLQLAKIKADTDLKVSNKWKNRPDDWDSETTRFSKGISNGSLKISKAYDAVGNHPSGAIIQRQLLVHDFFGQINKFGYKEFLRDWKSPWTLPTAEENRRFSMWKNSQTGYPIIDAAMLELKENGFICNRLRMLVASYLTKNMLVNWQLGEQYFGTQLEDYGDKASNIGNWLWVSGAGFNTRVTDVIRPEIQARKVDPRGSLRKKWEPKLKTSDIEFEYVETKKIWLNITTTT